MKIRHSGAKYSAIVGISEELRKKSLDENREYLLLNRGVNAVENIDINELVKSIDFNSTQMQVYPPAMGRPKLRQAINQVYFQSSVDIDHILITNGGTGALDLAFKTLDVDSLLLPPYYWGAYLNLLKINKIYAEFYSSIEELYSNSENLGGRAVLICDPNNPSGQKEDDEILFELIRTLNSKGVLIIFDSPYRRLFVDWEKDDFYKRIASFENVIICESFSKSVGLSGQRIGFIYAKNEELLKEMRVNLLFATNGVNNFAQILVEMLLTDSKGKQAVNKFKKNTVFEIEKNINYLWDRGFIAREFYPKGKPQGIFVIINRSYEELLEFQIGSVSFNYFSQLPIQQAAKYSRICVSVSHEKLRAYFEKMI